MKSLKLIGLALGASLALSTAALAQDITIAVAGPMTGGESAFDHQMKLSRPFCRIARLSRPMATQVNTTISTAFCGTRFAPLSFAKCGGSRPWRAKAKMRRDAPCTLAM